MYQAGHLWVLRLNHRIERDKRLTTHVALAARALGCKGIFIHGEHDVLLKERIDKVTREWGGDFQIILVDSWKRCCNDFKKGGNGIIVHLTFKGELLQTFENEIKELLNQRSVLVVVGGAKVPAGIYNVVDYNVAVTKQPHSEVSALAIFIDHILDNALEIDFKSNGTK
ncbi:MAG: tRNA (cytidine(56)-2'-O)-methyltransferase [Candidatus Odinarchaeota archaeon]